MLLPTAILSELATIRSRFSDPPAGDLTALPPVHGMEKKTTRPRRDIKVFGIRRTTKPLPVFGRDTYLQELGLRHFLWTSVGGCRT